MTALDREEFGRLEQLFYAALDLEDGPQRERYLTGITTQDPPTGEQVRALLEQHRQVAAATALRPAERFPRFGAWQAIRVLGRGGMGSVYLAERGDGAFEMLAAVKVVPLALASSDIEERFLRERQFLATLNHPGISRLIDGGVSEIGLPFLVMEFVDGEPIHHYADRHSLSRDDRVGLVRQMLGALAYVHSQNVLHRDLKPSNILVDERAHVKLVDFGIARVISAEIETRGLTHPSLALTPDYASPEQLRGERLSPASDTYSTGILLHQLVTGRVPPREDGAVRLQAIEPNLDSILRKATASDPALRYSSAEAMNADLQLYVAGQAPVAMGEKTQRAKRIDVRLVSAFVIAALLVGFVALAWWIRRTPAVNGPASIAILPFVNEQKDPHIQYLVDGISERLRDRLSRNKLMLVIARPSSGLFESKKAEEIGKRLHVANVLEGSVTKLQNRARIEARLIRTSDGAEIWSNTFDRQSNDLNSVDAALAAAITANLRAVAGSPPAQHQPTLEATEWMMRGRYDIQTGTPQALKTAEADYRKAMEFDPQYAAAYSALAGAIFSRYQAEFRDHTDEEMTEIEMLARKALELDPLLPQAHVLLGVIAHQYRWDWVTAEKEYTLAAAGARDAQAECSLSALLVHRARFAEAEPHIERALRLDPYGANTLNSLAAVFYWMGRRDRASEMARRYHEVAPNAIQAQALYLTALVVDGHADEAWPQFKKLRERAPAAGAMFEAWSRALAGQKEETLKLIRPLEARYPDPGVPLQGFALAYARLGDEENTVKWLERAADRHEWQVLNLGVNPSFRKMEDSPGFHRLKKRIGLE
ncbi:MAG: protein kinase [Acidobacteriaceae bacterium]|nr:protein kinase [Acidobacteriaceae bacterium]